MEGPALQAIVRVTFSGEDGIDGLRDSTWLLDSSAVSDWSWSVGRDAVLLVQVASNQIAVQAGAKVARLMIIAAVLVVHCSFWLGCGREIEMMWREELMGQNNYDELSAV